MFSLFTNFFPTSVLTFTIQKTDGHQKRYSMFRQNEVPDIVQYAPKYDYHRVEAVSGKLCVEELCGTAQILLKTEINNVHIALLWQCGGI